MAFFAAVSRGFLGQRLMRVLRDEGVDCRAVARVDAPTTLGLVGPDACDPNLGLLLPRVEPADFAADALARGVGLVVVTRGGEGAQGWTRNATARAAPVAVDVIDTVGAGDTFQAALLTWLTEHDCLAAQALDGLSQGTLHDALGFAARAAAVPAGTRPGAQQRRRQAATVNRLRAALCSPAVRQHRIVCACRLR